MKNKPLIPYRPLPETNETLKGYLLRIAYENGYASLNLLGRVIGKRISPLLYRADTSENINLSRLLRSHLCLTPKEWRICELKNVSLIQNFFDIVNFSDKRIKFCLECFKETPLLDKKWEAIHTTHCSKHNCQLIHTCPRCDKKFVENTQFFDSCSRCGLRWEDICSVKSPLAPYQILDESLVGNEQIRYRAALFKMLVFMIRPFDLHLTTYQRFPVFTNEHSMKYYLSCAFEMLSNATFAKSALERRTKLHTEQGSLKLLTPHLSYFDEEILASIDSVSAIVPYYSDDKIKLPDGLNCTISHTNDFPFKLGSRATSKLLGIAITDVNDLRKEGVINDSEFIGVRNHGWFDIRRIETSLSNLHIRKINYYTERKKWVNLFKLKGTLQRYNLSYARSLKLLIDNNFELVTVKDNWRLSDLFICRDKAINFFEKNFLDSLAGPIRKENITTFFHLNGKQFEAFKLLFKDKLIFEKNNFGYIPGEDIKIFLETHLILNKHCRLQKVNLKSCFNELKTKGIIPTLPDTTMSDLYIYKKTPYLKTTLKAITLQLSQ